jgi:hypothetical protein
MESILGVLVAISALLFAYYGYRVLVKKNSTKEIQTTTNTVVEIVEPTPVAVQPEPVQAEVTKKVAEKPKKTRKSTAVKAEKNMDNVVTLPVKTKKPGKKKSEKDSNKP